MRDPLWRAVWRHLCPLLNADDVVLAPKGDWHAFPCAPMFYRDLIAVEGSTVLLLHKALLTGLPKPELRRIAAEWQWIFANEVFIVLSRTEKISRDARSTAMAVHCQPLVRYLGSASLRRRRGRIVYVHVPKTGGTSMWALLTRAFPSHVYYPSLTTYSSNPPSPDEYDLVGVHFSPAVLLDSLGADDWLIGMVRDPTQRFLSGIAHARRQTEDPQTFTASTRAMRDMNLLDYLTADFGRAEARLQLTTFGAGYHRSGAMPSDEQMLHSAVGLVQRENVILGPSERSRALRAFLAKQLGFRPGRLGHLNAGGTQAVRVPEFDHAVGLIQAINRCEREFYNFVCASFAQRQIARAQRPAISPSRFYASANTRDALGDLSR